MTIKCVVVLLHKLLSYICRDVEQDGESHEGPCVNHVA